MKIRISFLAIILTFTWVSCTEDFEEINTNPVTSNMPTAGAFFNQIVQNPVRDYQRKINLHADLFCQYWANTDRRFDSSRYEYVEGWVSFIWRDFYVNTLGESITIREIYGDDPTYKNALAQLEIWMCAEWARITQIFGDIAYFGAGMGGEVAYTSESEIYNDLFARLDAAVKAIDATDTSQFAFNQDDLIYRSDMEKWKRFGNSIRLRLAMRLANIDPARAQAEASAAVNLGVMTSNDDVAQIPLWINGGYDYVDTVANNFDDVAASETFVNYLYSEAGFEDPRADKWLAFKSDSPFTGGDFVGLRNGFDNPPSNAETAFATVKSPEFGGEYSGFVGDGGEISAYMPIMFYSEVLFLQAEAAMRGWIGGDANSLYQDGIRASMEFVGVETADADAYIAAVPGLTGANEASLKQLITQKYIANFPNGSEAWADFRRTDYPDITLPVDGVSSNSSVEPNTWVKRIRYPDNAHNFDFNNLPENIKESLDNELSSIQKNRMDAKLWWDTADTKTKSGGLMNSNF